MFLVTITMFSSSSQHAVNNIVNRNQCFQKNLHLEILVSFKSTFELEVTFDIWDFGLLGPPPLSGKNEEWKTLPGEQAKLGKNLLWAPRAFWHQKLLPSRLWDVMKTAVFSLRQPHYLKNLFLFLMLNSLVPEIIKLVLGDLKDITYIKYVANR